MRHQFNTLGQYVGNLLADDKLISSKHHEEVVLMYKEHIMRLEFDKADLQGEVEFYKSKLFPVASQQINTGNNKPVFARNSVGRARMMAEAAAYKRVEKK